MSTKSNESLVNLIQEAANAAGLTPGIYKMINDENKVIYVGKAKYLKNRLMSYIRIDQMSNRLKMMVSNIKRVETTITNTEVEALLLETNLIKQLKPFYNILLKDDKTFPYIFIDCNHAFPRVFKYRTLKCRGDNFFGPYPAITALDDSLKIIQKAFLLRNCTDNCFSNRSRPCLQYFIKRCSAPCVGKISQEEYAKNVELARKLLLGKDEVARKMLVEEMRIASTELNFEKAALLRDRIKSITEIQSKQYIQIDKTSSIDFIALAKGSEHSVIFMLFFRGGKNVGTENFIIQNSFESDTPSSIIESFINQLYKNVQIPSTIVTSHDIKNKSSFRDAIKQQFGKKPKILYGNQGVYKKIMDTALTNAQMKLNKNNTDEHQTQIAELSNLIGTEKLIRIETYDNSHIGGTSSCGVMTVFENGNFRKNQYRRFNIDNETANKGDDISMMKFSLNKRFRSKKITEIPDLIIIDGGRTQLSVAIEILQNFDLLGKTKILSIAKQNNRKSGDEKIILESGIEAAVNTELLNFLIMLRDEAHKEAITFHRKKRQKTLSKSVLDDIPSIGIVRKRKLLEHFGSIAVIQKASIDDLKMVKGIDNKAAKIIYDFFNIGSK